MNSCITVKVIGYMLWFKCLYLTTLIQLCHLFGRSSTAYCEFLFLQPGALLLALTRKECMKDVFLWFLFHIVSVDKCQQSKRSVCVPSVVFLL